jgi:hypothetical protein
MTKKSQNTIGLAILITTIIALSQSESHMAHPTLQVDPSEPIPSLEITVEPDLKSGYNLSISLSNFEFVPEKASMDDQTNGEGHAHLFINDKKITRLYNTYTYLPEDWLIEGENTVRVSLNANDHSDWIFGEETIFDEVIFEHSSQSMSMEMNM